VQVLTINELRLANRLEPIDGGDVLIKPHLEKLRPGKPDSEN
jgi:hypothetical protein